MYISLLLMLMSAPLENWFPSVTSQPNSRAQGRARVTLKLLNNWQCRHLLVKMMNQHRCGQQARPYQCVLAECQPWG